MKFLSILLLFLCCSIFSANRDFHAVEVERDMHAEFVHFVEGYIEYIEKVSTTGIKEYSDPQREVEHQATRILHGLIEGTMFHIKYLKLEEVSDDVAQCQARFIFVYENRNKNIGALKDLLTEIKGKTWEDIRSECITVKIPNYKRDMVDLFIYRVIDGYLEIQQPLNDDDFLSFARNYVDTLPNHESEADKDLRLSNTQVDIVREHNMIAVRDMDEFRRMAALYLCKQRFVGWYGERTIEELQSYLTELEQKSWRDVQVEFDVEGF